MQMKSFISVNKRLPFFCFTLVTIAGLLFFSSARAGESEKLTIYVVNYPLQYFAERIAGEHAAVVFPAPADVDPAYWMPGPKKISDYQRADLILLNGANYAKWVNKVSLPRFRMVNTSAAFKDRYIEAAEILTHSHGGEGEHAHESLAFTTWVDFSLAAEQAKAIEKALSRKKPALKDTFQRNYEELERQLHKLDRDIKKVVSKDRSRPLVVSHPVYDYFARRYELNIKSVHWEPDEIPTTEQMLKLHSILKDHPAKWMIWEGESIKESVERLKAIGMQSVVFDPCGNEPDQGDFMSVMRQNVENIKEAFR
ncbi:MAG: metal ABC transporter substrate-binding protein [Deltaproteobacteria bacterium]|nr:metal ABC transporter substrate-binding protein [Deltaproteobacteria bacterium]MDH3898526.1 metal ABC transporter substrate-binding protein [Deltaproteobacteria bacterium]MDH3963630.1 metal ABC transporter substrate-binding protein [Deltaproteobacteria bacterium]